MIICRCDLAEGCPGESFHERRRRAPPLGLEGMGRGEGGGVSERGVVGGTRRGHGVEDEEREREGRVSSSRQKQIAIVCEEPRQCRA